MAVGGNPLSRSLLEGKADIAFCGAYVGIWSKADISPIFAIAVIGLPAVDTGIEAHELV